MGTLYKAPGWRLFFILCSDRPQWGHGAQNYSPWSTVRTFVLMGRAKKKQPSEKCLAVGVLQRNYCLEAGSLRVSNWNNNTQGLKNSLVPDCTPLRRTSLQRVLWSTPINNLYMT